MPYAPMFQPSSPITGCRPPCLSKLAWTCQGCPRVVRGRVLLFSSLDNLLKGASGAAAQNFNLMYGFEETMALV